MLRPVNSYILEYCILFIYFINLLQTNIQSTTVWMIWFFVFGCCGLLFWYFKSRQAEEEPAGVSQTNRLTIWWCHGKTCDSAVAPSLHNHKCCCFFSNNDVMLWWRLNPSSHSPALSLLRLLIIWSENCLWDRYSDEHSKRKKRSSDKADFSWEDPI